jgi:hypothetical protein
MCQSAKPAGRVSADLSLSRFRDSLHPAHRRPPTAPGFKASEREPQYYPVTTLSTVVGSHAWDASPRRECLDSRVRAAAPVTANGLDSPARQGERQPSATCLVEPDWCGNVAAGRASDSDAAGLTPPAPQRRGIRAPLRQSCARHQAFGFRQQAAGLASVHFRRSFSLSLKSTSPSWNRRDAVMASVAASCSHMAAGGKGARGWGCRADRRVGGWGGDHTVARLFGIQSQPRLLSRRALLEALPSDMAGRRVRTRTRGPPTTWLGRPDSNCSKDQHNWEACQ